LLPKLLLWIRLRNLPHSQQAQVNQQGGTKQNGSV